MGFCKLHRSQKLNFIPRLIPENGREYALTQIVTTLSADGSVAYELLLDRSAQ